MAVFIHQTIGVKKISILRVVKRYRRPPRGGGGGYSNIGKGGVARREKSGYLPK